MKNTKRAGKFSFYWNRVWFGILLIVIAVLLFLYRENIASFFRIHYYGAADSRSLVPIAFITGLIGFLVTLAGLLKRYPSESKDDAHKENANN